MRVAGVAKARIETNIAVAHRRLWESAQAADQAGDHGLSEDLHQICGELARLQNDLLRGKQLRTRPIGPRA